MGFGSHEVRSHDHTKLNTCDWLNCVLLIGTTASHGETGVELVQDWPGGWRRQRGRDWISWKPRNATPTEDGKHTVIICNLWHSKTQPVCLSYTCLCFVFCVVYVHKNFWGMQIFWWLLSAKLSSVEFCYHRKRYKWSLIIKSVKILASVSCENSLENYVYSIYLSLPVCLYKLLPLTVFINSVFLLNFKIKKMTQCFYLACNDIL